MLQPSDAERLADRFGLPGPARLTGPVDRGELGQVWQLTTAAGRFAVKETFGALDDAQIVRVVELQQRAADQGVRVPDQRRSVDGEPALRDFGAPVRVYEWLELRPADRRMEPGPVGRMLAALHRAMPATSEPVDPFFWAPVGRRRWAELIELCRAARAPFAEALAGWCPDLEAAESIMVEPGTDLIISHRDLWADNVRLDDRGVITVIDWDNGGAASPSHELAMIMIEFGVGPDGPARGRALHRAYRDAGGPGVVTGPSDFTMPLAILGHLVELDVRRWLEADPTDPAGAALRERSVRRLAEYDADPVTLQTVRGLLEALG